MQTQCPALNVGGLTSLMNLTKGISDVAIGLVDGPVALDHPDLTQEAVRELPGGISGRCSRVSSLACQHGTFVAGILSAKRGSGAPAISPGCTLLVRSIFIETAVTNTDMLSATPDVLAAAIIDCIDAGARVVNLSVAIVGASLRTDGALRGALDHAVRCGVLMVAAAGNQGTLGSSMITRHSWVIPVVACDLQGNPMGASNLASSIGRHGLRAPGDSITSLGADGKPLRSGGTSAATPFVTGAIALLWSLFPTAATNEIRFAITQAYRARQTTIVPPLLDAWQAYRWIEKRHR